MGTQSAPHTRNKDSKLQSLHFIHWSLKKDIVWQRLVLQENRLAKEHRASNTNSRTYLLRGIRAHLPPRNEKMYKRSVESATGAVFFCSIYNDQISRREAAIEKLTTKKRGGAPTKLNMIEGRGEARMQNSWIILLFYAKPTTECERKL